MIYFKSSGFSYLNGTTRKFPIPQLFYVLALNPPPLTIFPRYSTNSVNNEHPFPVSYLVNTCGFSLEDAILASNKLQFRTPKRPDSVISFFKNHGFSNHQILGIIKSDPRLLLFNPEKTFLPKFEFLCSKGVSGPELVQIIYKDTRFLRRSLENNIVPGYNLVRSLLGSDQRVIRALKVYPYLISVNLNLQVVPNINLLRSIGVPETNIAALIDNNSRALFVNLDKFVKTVEEVKRLGFNPSKNNFLTALSILTILGKSKWQQKYDTYKQWGWSEQEFYAAFRVYPYIMSASHGKMLAIMHLFGNHLGVAPSALVKKPVIFGMSLAKRLIPRASVIQFLLSKRLLTKEPSWISGFIIPDKVFLEKFVYHYKKEASQLLKIYKENPDQRYLYHVEGKT